LLLPSTRSFSSSSVQRNQATDSIKGFFRQTKASAQKAVGRQTDSEKEEIAAIAEMKPNEEKGLARLYRKRWGRPQLVFNAESERYEQKILEHKYSTAYFRISHRKLQLLADQIGGGKPIDYSILQMQFSQKRAAKRIKSTLALARDHAVIKGLNLSKMVVAEAWVGKGRTFKRIEPKGRGRTGVRKSLF
jgi:large subunit ribosomal protein L22